MTLKEIYQYIKMFIIDKYNKLIASIKNMQCEKTQINNQTSNTDIHVIKATVKKVKVKNKMKTNN